MFQSNHLKRDVIPDLSQWTLNESTAFQPTKNQRFTRVRQIGEFAPKVNFSVHLPINLEASATVAPNCHSYALEW
jgi:hypothetical protein